MFHDTCNMKQVMIKLKALIYMNFKIITYPIETIR